MPVTMICPNLKCGRTVTAADAARGRVVRCAHCQQLFMVPQTVPGTSGPADIPTVGEAPPAAPPPKKGRR